MCILPGNSGLPVKRPVHVPCQATGPVHRNSSCALRASTTRTKMRSQDSLTEWHVPPLTPPPALMFTFTTDGRVTAKKNHKSSFLKGKTTPPQKKQKQKNPNNKKQNTKSIRPTTVYHLTRKPTRLSSSWVCTRP